MIKLRPLFFLGAFYELLRTIIFFILTIGIVSPEIDQIVIFLFVLLASPGFVLFAGFLFVGIYPKKFQESTKILAVGKVSAVFPVIIGGLNSLGILSFSSARYQLTSAGLLFGIIILFDLLFFLFLVSYRGREKDVNETPSRDEREPSEDELPDIKEVDVED